jgi:hypothetical protein
VLLSGVEVLLFGEQELESPANIQRVRMRGASRVGPGVAVPANLSQEDEPDPLDYFKMQLFKQAALWVLCAACFLWICFY